MLLTLDPQSCLPSTWRAFLFIRRFQSSSKSHFTFHYGSLRKMIKVSPLWHKGHREACRFLQHNTGCSWKAAYTFMESDTCLEHNDRRAIFMEEQWASANTYQIGLFFLLPSWIWEWSAAKLAIWSQRGNDRNTVYSSPWPTTSNSHSASR